MARHGAIGLLRIAFSVLRDQGVRETFRMAAGDRPFLSAMSRHPDPKPRRLWPPELDGAGTLAADDWARWLRRRSAKLTRQPPVKLIAVIGQGAEDTEKVQLTLAAIEAAAGLQSVILDRDSFPSAGLEPEALYLFLKAGDRPIAGLAPALQTAAGGADILTFDMIRHAGARVQLLLLPGVNAPLLEERDYILSRAAVRGSVLLETPSAPLRERLLSWRRARSASDVGAKWRHIGQPLLDITASAAPSAEKCSSVARYRTPGAAGGVSIVLCTRDKGHLTRQLVRQLLHWPAEALAEVVIVSNGTRNPYALQTLADLAREDRVRVLPMDEPFNFSRLCNAGARATRAGGPLLFLNDDIAPISEYWLEALRARLETPDTGAVGPLLLYPDERVQHAGMYLQPAAEGAGHYLRGARLPDCDPLGLADSAREVTCLTGAALLTRRSVFENLGGFDEDFAVAFQDVDYCLRVRDRGLRNLFEPRAVLLHMESASIGATLQNASMAARRYREKKLFEARWAKAYPFDPFVPTELDPLDETLRRLHRP